jgi:uncharacterized membrane protein (DUF485 family)
MVSPEPGDPTPSIGASIHFYLPDHLELQFSKGAKPVREHAVEQLDGRVDWDEIANRLDVRPPARKTADFIVPGSIVFLVYYLLVVALSSYARPFMGMRVGPVSVGYLFSLSQFFVAWTVAGLYVRAANIFDRDPCAILEGFCENLGSQARNQPEYPPPIQRYERLPHNN